MAVVANLRLVARVVVVVVCVGQSEVIKLLLALAICVVFAGCHSGSLVVVGAVWRGRGSTLVNATTVTLFSSSFSYTENFGLFLGTAGEGRIL